MARTPAAVLSSVGQIQVMKITKIAEGFTALNSNRPIGSQASGLTGRNTWINGCQAVLKVLLMPMRKPSGIATATASENPPATRPSEYSSCQPIPLSFGPASRNGSAKISSARSSTAPGVGSSGANCDCTMAQNTIRIANVSNGSVKRTTRSRPGVAGLRVVTGTAGGVVAVDALTGFSSGVASLTMVAAMIPPYTKDLLV